MTELATKADLLAVKTDLTTALDNAVLRLTIRLGTMIAGAVAVLGILDRLLRP
ncbi:hypothetical protein [Bradyrhizobium sp. SZCCHNR3118]|uniref:hypothetical protein n=1 Tax=Bradyrhizobium sp. SZCCHNR3118 TaxID=3057468 RepID=UPI002916331B|nr:hypothetical protein [Bradyrhizobium sp. SZCCHNR3118]